MELNTSQRVLNLRHKLRLKQSELAPLLGLSRNYVSMIESGREPSKGIMTRIEDLERSIVEEGESPVITDAQSLPFSAPPKPTSLPPPSLLQKEPALYRVSNMGRPVPVVSWAHAGAAASYEEMPRGYHDPLPSLVHDPEAFALILEGDSMEPIYRGGDVLVLMPSEKPRNGCLVVARFADDGVMFRRCQILNRGRFRLIALNSLYTATEHEPSEFQWIYPVFSVTKMEWSR